MHIDIPMHGYVRLKTNQGLYNTCEGVTRMLVYCRDVHSLGYYEDGKYIQDPMLTLSHVIIEEIGLSLGSIVHEPLPSHGHLSGFDSLQMKHSKQFWFVHS